METIFAPATAAGKAGVSVVRISGPEARAAAKALGAEVPGGGRGLRHLRDRDGKLLDQALVLDFPKGQSFTGDEIIELHLHGSVAVLKAVMEELAAQKNLRLAEPGEFTRRALAAGKMALVEVEALADLIEAETEAQRRQAQSVLSGALGQKAAEWREVLIGISANLAVAIDFADEDIPATVLDDLSGQLHNLEQEFHNEIKGGLVAERVRHGFEVAILGPPNAGKSTLLNRLAGRDASITSEIAGTTRDIVEVRFDLNGLPVTFLDTAGLHETEDKIERLGIERAKSRAATADLRVFLDDGGGRDTTLQQAGDIVVHGKSDLTPERGGVSGVTGAGLETLLAGIDATLRERVGTAGVLIRERHRQGLQRAIEHLGAAQFQLGSDQIDLAAEEVGATIRAIDAIVGRVDVETVLDEVFSAFCLGK